MLRELRFRRRMAMVERHRALILPLPDTLFTLFGKVCQTFTQRYGRRGRLLIDRVSDCRLPNEERVLKRAKQF